MTESAGRTTPCPQLLDDDVARASGQIYASRPEDDSLLDRVRARLLRKAADESQERLHTTVRAMDAAWEQIAPGVQRKRLFESAEAESSMVRLAPGAIVPRHSHPIDEECIVLEGTLRIGVDLLLLPGDFHAARRGVPHAQISSDSGALVYLRCARHALELMR